MGTVTTKNNMEFDKRIKELLKGIRVSESDIQGKLDKVQEIGLSPIRVCSYGRVSTKSDEQESSLINQHTIFNNYCDRQLENGWVLVEEVFDQKTGTLMAKRPKFQNMIQRALNGEFDILLFKDTKRMCRNNPEFLDLTERLKRKNIACVFIAEGINTLTASRETLTVLGLVAESTSNGLHVSVQTSKRLNMQRPEGRVPSHCFGYTKPVSNNSTEMYINEAESELVRELFNRYVNLNEGFSTIRDDWNNRGVHVFKDRKVNIKTLKRMIDNKMYIGTLEMGVYTKADVRADTIKGDPLYVCQREDLRIVTDEMFDKAQEKRKRFRESYKTDKGIINRRTIFSTKIKCEVCGCSYTRIKGGYGNRLCSYYVCAGRRNKDLRGKVHECTNSMTYRQDELLDCLEQYMLQILTNKNKIKSIVRKVVTNIHKEMEADIDNYKLSSEIERAEDEYNREIDLYRAGLSNDLELLKKKKETLEKLKDKHGVISRVTFSEKEIDRVVENLCKNIESVISGGLAGLGDGGDDALAVRFNNLFSSILARENGELIINMNGSNNLSSLVDSNFYYGSLKYNSEQEDEIRAGIVNGVYCVSISSLFDWDEINRNMNSIRLKDSHNKAVYRLRKRYRTLGKELFDVVNIVL